MTANSLIYCTLLVEHHGGQFAPEPFIYFNIHTCHKPYKEGALGFSVLRIWPMFGSVFALENCGFQFCVLPRFAGFLEFSLCFMLFVNNDGGFSVIFCPAAHFTVFLVLPRKLHPAVALNPA